MPFHVGFLVFPDIQQLDIAGPYDVFTTAEGIKVDLVWKDREPVRSFTGTYFTGTETFATCPQLDLLCIPGGAGTGPLMADADVLEFIRRQAVNAKFVTSVCTGSLVLGAAGLLSGKRATCHWNFLDYLTQFNASPVSERVVQDGNLITAAGVSAGIDFAFSVLAEVISREESEMIQLWLEYAPRPPFHCGNTEEASSDILQKTRERYQQARLELDPSRRFRTNQEKSWYSPQ